MIPLFKVNMSPEASSAVEKTLASGMIGEGERVAEFTGELSRLFDHPNITCTNSCTSALTLALRLTGVTYNDKVISSFFTFPATNCAIKAVGGSIIWAKIDPESLCSDTKDVLCKALQNNAKAVVITLVSGNVPKDLDKLWWALRQASIPLILDAAHGLFTMYKDKHISHWADYCCFSFQSIKHLTTGDGGALVCQQSEQYERAKEMKWFGISREIPKGKTRLEHQMTSAIEEWGYKFHMNDIAASIGLANLETARTAVKISCYNADWLSSQLPNSVLPIQAIDCSPSWWVWGFRFREPISIEEAIRYIREFKDLGIAASSLWVNNGKHYDFPHCYSNKIHTLFLPSGFWVGEQELEVISKAIKKVFK